MESDWLGAPELPETDPGASLEERLKFIREAIDRLDVEIVALLNDRAALSLEVGRIKAGSKELVFKPFREIEVLKRIEEINSGSLPVEHLSAIYREIFSSSRALQRPQRVAYLGPEGTFSYFAGVSFLGHTVDFTPAQTIHAAFSMLNSGDAELAIIPLENSLEGTVGQSLDLFMKYEAYIQAETFSRISHSLMGAAVPLSEIRTVYSHPQPLAQCAGWLRTNLPQAAVVPLESTAASARKVAHMLATDPSVAAIGHKGLAAMNGLTLLAGSIEDSPDNWTRFVVIAKKPASEKARDKTSLLFTLPDKAGSLVQVLSILAKESINMKKLESRPLRGEKWQYVFFVDVECDLSADRYEAVLAEMGHACHSLRVLGSYPAGQELNQTLEEGAETADSQAPKETER